MNLLTFYLGVKLPFEVTWSGDAIGVGSPYIAAGKGPDTGGWARSVNFSDFKQACRSFL